MIKDACTLRLSCRVRDNETHILLAARSLIFENRRRPLIAKEFDDFDLLIFDENFLDLLSFHLLSGLFSAEKNYPNDYELVIYILAKDGQYAIQIDRERIAENRDQELIFKFEETDPKKNLNNEEKCKAFAGIIIQAIKERLIENPVSYCDGLWGHYNDGAFFKL